MGSGIFRGLQAGCTPQLNLPANRNSAGQWQESESSIKRAIATFWVNHSLHPSLGDPFITTWILTGGRRGSGRSSLGVEGGFLRIVLSPQPPKRSPLGPGGTEPESDCTEGHQRGEREREVPAWAPLPGKKLRVGWGTVCRPAQSGEFKDLLLSLA